jgi:hypothetical protein
MAWAIHELFECEGAGDEAKLPGLFFLGYGFSGTRFVPVKKIGALARNGKKKVRL